jgi:hypothetical protein
MDEWEGNTGNMKIVLFENLPLSATFSTTNKPGLKSGLRGKKSTIYDLSHGTTTLIIKH